MNKICFAMQPFDSGKFDRRYKEIIEPVIVECGFDAYRVDEDVTSIVPIESIHMNIRNSSLCIAEITTDNPNVWYELGYTLACEKPVIMLCSDERSTPFPFDIRHRNVLTYGTQSPSDFESLKQKLKARIMSYGQTFEVMSYNILLDSYEIAIIKVIMENQNTPSELTSKNKIIDTSISNAKIINAIRKLTNKKLIEYVYSTESDGIKSYYRLTDVGEKWIELNEGQILKG